MPPAQPGDESPDIVLPLGDDPPDTTVPAYSSPPAWMPPPVMPRAPAETPPLAAVTTCPQCLSAVVEDDVFCGVCGFRLQ
jgi:hypothetical protein